MATRGASAPNAMPVTAVVTGYGVLAPYTSQCMAAWLHRPEVSRGVLRESNHLVTTGSA